MSGLTTVGWMFIGQGLVVLLLVGAAIKRFVEDSKQRASQDDFIKKHEDKGIFLGGRGHAKGEQR